MRYRPSLIVLSQSDPVRWDPSVEMGPEETALSWGTELGRRPEDPPGFHSVGEDQRLLLCHDTLMCVVRVIRCLD